MVADHTPPANSITYLDGVINLNTLSSALADRNSDELIFLCRVFSPGIRELFSALFRTTRKKTYFLIECVGLVNVDSQTDKRSKLGMN